MSGSVPHLFMTRGDLTRFACDAWLLPTDRWLTIEHSWKGAINALPELPSEWQSERVRVVRGQPRPGDPRALWLANVGRDGAPISWYQAAVDQFVERATASLPAPPFGRSRPLLAVPAVGIGKGGAEMFAGSLLEGLLATLQTAARRSDVDIALVTYDDRTFSAAQAVRRRLAADAVWPLPDTLHEAARALARLAVAGRLVLFIGAGVSSGSGLPGWGDLLDRLAADAGLDSGAVQSLRSWDARDRALIVQSRLGDAKPTLGERVAQLLDSPWRSLAHTQLASMPVGEMATTNYDTLIEGARGDIGRDVAVLPYEAVRENGGWLLKLHGSVTHPDDIVLTRQDYLRFNQSRAALAGIVQALLVTRHMLFVGFSLRDENFHRIAYDVRNAMQARTGDRTDRPFGTSLVLDDPGFASDVWRNDVRFVNVGAGTSDRRAAARQFEIFMDVLLHHASVGTAHLMDPSYEGALTMAERRLRDALAAFAAGLDAEVRRTDAWERIETLMRSVGWESDSGAKLSQ